MDLTRYRIALEARGTELARRIDTGALGEIRAALKRIEDGRFGVCLRCGRPISQKRLDAVPWAAFCITCQEKVDDLHDRIYAMRGRDAA